jgi:hypothetical protein
MYIIQPYCSKRIRSKLRRQGAQSLRSEAYLGAGRNDEGCCATSPEGDKQYMDSCTLQGILRSRSI